MFLQSSKVLLRSFSPEDADQYYEIACDDSIRKYLMYFYTKTPDDSVRLINDLCNCDFSNNFWFAVCDSRTGELVGVLAAFRTFSLVLEICFFTGKKYRRCGYCINALELFINYVKENTKYASLFFNVETTNASSHAILRRLGISIQDGQEYFVYSLHTRK